MLQSFRRSRCPISALDGTVYDYSATCYPEVIYVQGAKYLEKYRRAVGDEAFWAGLSQFYKDYQLKIAGTRTLLSYLDDASGFDGARHGVRFPSLYP
jgi:aminopeptidase N